MRKLLMDLIRKNIWMRNICVAFVFGLTVFGCFASGQMVSYANSPAPAGSFTIYGDELPQETDRLELLIPISEGDAAYMLYNEKFEELTGLDPDSEIVTYRDAEGYVSYCAHMAGATCRTWENDLGERRTEWAFDFGVNGTVEGQSHLKYIQEQFGAIKVAVLDDAGAVLQVSTKAAIAPKSRRGYLTSGLRYNGTTGELDANIYEGYSLSSILGALLSSLFWLLFAPGGLIFHMMLTVIVECVAAYLFKIGSILTVAKVNLFSNLLFNLLMQCMGGNYVAKLVFLELVVVMGEYWYYRKKFDEIGTRKLAIFTLTANIASLVCGLLTAAIS
ncbi:MAG: hypothetical protein Q4F28_03140 [Eubacteriales bacterium]|nr:hypothetical protein [Eubacteriales bacterium]